MVTQSESVASLVVPHHYKDAMKALDSLKNVKNTTLDSLAGKLRTSWEQLALNCTQDNRDDALAGQR